MDVLKAAYAEGRLSHGEYVQRIDCAHRAVTLGELSGLVRDLPQGPVPVMMPQQQPFPAQLPATFLPRPPLPPPNGMAVGSLICGMLTVVTWGVAGVPAVVLGHVAKSRIRRTGERGEGMATAGLVLGYVSVAFWAVVLCMAMVMMITQ
ncbi:DUF1707 and DUF4190 domain-containing protein [Streptomyces sp. MTZ3.1]|uniref:DUF1707 and DUF4190 domain-containing protein n=2 Tax=Streptomyces meridianus TaxID=2938945 RepID=A0ABT0X7W4_9ACTN|nr:DUF1707 and DUF4190 domain-containing protein [Streptomyces meridianus]